MNGHEPWTNGDARVDPPASYFIAPTVDLRDALKRTAERGTAFVPDALTEIACARIAREVRRVEFSSEDGAPEVDVATLEARSERFPTLTQLRRSFTDLVRDAGEGIRGLATYRANEIQVLRYPPGTSGVASHRDPERYRRIIAVFTVGGRGTFSVQRSQDDEDIRSWDVGARSLILLRAPGLAGRRDGRPFHATGGPTGRRRLAVALLMAAADR